MLLFHDMGHVPLRRLHKDSLLEEKLTGEVIHIQGDSPSIVLITVGYKYSRFLIAKFVH